MTESPDVALSIVMPFYKKLTELSMVLPNNARFVGRTDVELILVLDEPSEEAGVLALLDQLPLIKARVIVNDQPHEWRPPCAAINVGLRAAVGKFILVVSPESLFVDDVPSRVLHLLTRRPSDVVVGRVGWATFAAVHVQTPKALFESAIAAHGGRGFAADYYGSIAAARDLFTAVRGYDESLVGWGGDDDNIRARLSIAGALVTLDRSLRLLHLSKGSPQRYRRPAATAKRLREIYSPSSAQANSDGWGEQFGRVALDWRDRPAPATRRATPVTAMPAGPARRQNLSMGTTGRKGLGRLDIVAVFSFRYDAHLVDDLITNLTPIVDGWVGYDDRDSEALFSNEVQRRRLLLQEAHRLGARWVLAIDPDERLEHGLAERIDELTRSIAPISWSFALREMYEADRYRCDGIWGRKEQSRLFPLRGDFVLPPNELHGSWCKFPARRSGFNLYHLKMIAPERRQERAQLYRFLDPENQHQEMGYDYLADETDAVLEPIPEGRGYYPAHRDDGELWMPRVPVTR